MCWVCDCCYIGCVLCLFGRSMIFIFLVMAQMSKRGLRQRNKKKVFGEEVRLLVTKVQEEEGNGYVKPYAKEIYNPSLQLNLDAKILIKFLNTINKKYHQYHQAIEKSQAKAHLLEQQHPTKDQNTHSKNKTIAKCVNYTKIYNGPMAKKKINVPQASLTTEVSNGNKPIKNEEYLNKIKAMSQESASSMLQLEKALNKNQAPHHNNASKMSTSAPKNKQQTKNGALSRQKVQQGYDVKKIIVCRSGSNKNLKKSMMHVWIAHFVYKSQIKNQNDPTLAAKRLKEEVLKNNFVR